MEPERQLDDADVEILRALQDNARVSFAELGRKVGLSGPAITDRIRKMEETGIIRGYHADVNPAMLGYPVVARVGLRVAREHFHSVITMARDSQDVQSCHHTSGAEDFLLEIIAASAEALDRTIDRFRPFGEVRASVIISTPVEKYSI